MFADAGKTLWNIIRHVIMVALKRLFFFFFCFVSMERAGPVSAPVPGTRLILNLHVDRPVAFLCTACINKGSEWVTIAVFLMKHVLVSAADNVFQ